MAIRYDNLLVSNKKMLALATNEECMGGMDHGGESSQHMHAQKEKKKSTIGASLTRNSIFFRVHNLLFSLKSTKHHIQNTFISNYLIKI